LYEEQNHHDKAVLVLQRSLLMTEGSLGLDHLETAEVLNNLGANFYHLAKFDQAQPLQQRALAIHENVLGSEHLRTAKSLNKRFEDLIFVDECTFEIRKETYKKWHKKLPFQTVNGSVGKAAHNPKFNI
jgi:tetratricopeptide (TPR) repeat protein